MTGRAVVSTIPVTVLAHQFAKPRQFRIGETANFDTIFAASGLDPQRRRIVSIFVDGCRVPQELWPIARPKRLDEHGNERGVVIVPVAQGGRNSRKILSTAVTLAFIAAATFVTAGAAAPLLGAAFAVGTLGAAATATALAVAGAPAGRLLAPPPRRPE